MRSDPWSSTPSLASLALLALAACGDAAKPAASPVPAATSSAAVTVSAPPDAGSPEPSLPPGVPDTPAGHQLAWVFAALAQPPTEGDVTSRFDPGFLAQVPAAQIVAILGKLGAMLGTPAIDRVDGPSHDEVVVVVHPGGSASGPKLRVSLTVEGAEPHRIKGLLFRPVVDAKPAASWDEVQTGLRAVAPQVSFLAAEVAGGKCVPLSSIEPKKALALGSAFKLYVLEALARQIAARKRSWDDSLGIEEARKSLPSGDMRNEPAGKVFTVRQFAEKMISVSDNTAADHLLAYVGRSAVEEAVKSSGHATPARNVPFLSTRDLFALKLLGTADELHAYVAADVPHKRKVLEAFEQRDLSGVPLEEHGWSKPRMIDSIEWFASPEDLCKLMVSLKAHADLPATAPVGAILSINPGLPDEAGAYKYIGFKGGSEPGVMNLTWLLQRKSDDKWVFLTVGFNDGGAAIDETKAITAASVARDFLGK